MADPLAEAEGGTEGGGRRTQIREIGGQLFLIDLDTGEATPIRLPGTGETEAGTGATSTTTASSGDLSFDEQLRLRQTPSVSVSLSDPRRLALEAQELAQRQQQFEVEAQLAQQELAERIRQNDLQASQFNVEAQFLRDQLAVQQQQNLREDAQRTADRLADLSVVQQNLITQRSQLESEVRMLNARIQAETAQFNAAQQLATDRLNVEREQARQEQIQSVAGDIANLTQRSGDPTALAAFLRGGGAGLGAQSTLGQGEGEDFRTDTSLQPLEMLLGLRDQLNQPIDPIQAALANVSQAELPNFRNELADPNSFLSQILGAADPSAVAAPTAGIGTGDGSGAGGVPSSALPPSAADLGANEGTALVTSTGEPSTGILQGLQQAQVQRDTTGSVDQSFIDAFNQMLRDQGLQSLAGGGMVNEGGAARVHDNEIVLDHPEGFLVLNEEQQKELGITPEKLKGVAKAQEGGFFANNARAFLDSLLQPVLDQLGFSDVPTPVQVSAPGTPRLVQQQAAGLAATGRGIPTDFFQEIIQRIQPKGVRAGVTRRTR